MRITGQEIANWAGTAECRYKLPVLCRKLIVETTPKLVSFDFPSDTAVDLPGYDGITDNLEKTPWISEGKSFWEISCTKNPRTKAEKDYKKRTSQIAKQDKNEGSFVFVTAQRWDPKNKREWIDKKTKTNEWKCVKVFEADDLAAWLDSTFSTNLWFNDLLGNTTHGIYSPDEWWSDWQNVLSYEISSVLVATRQLNESKLLIDRIQEGNLAISVKGNSIDEAIAFVIASLREHKSPDLIDRTVVITQTGLEIKSPHQESIIVICAGDNVPKIRGNKNHTIIRAYHKGRIDVRDAIDLSYVPRDVFQEELKKKEIENEVAEQMALKSGYSIPALRRILSKDIEATKPNWVRDPEIVNQLVPFILCGHWSEGDMYKDSRIIEKLGDIDENCYHKLLEEFLKLEDTPLVRLNNQIIVISQIDTLTEIGFAIKRYHIDRFLEKFYQLFSEKDPKIDFFKSNWWETGFPEEEKTYSIIRTGLCKTLCMLSIFGDRICGENFEVPIITQKVDDVVKKLLNNADSDQLLNIREYFSYFAEASPEIFLDCIENNLKLKNSSLMRLLDPLGNDYFQKDNFRQNFFGSLEKLAWLPPYFKKVTNILFRLHKLLERDNVENPIQAEIDSIFRVWLPSTFLTVEERFQVLQNNEIANRDAVINTCISLLPKRMGSGIRTSLPRWRILERALTTGTADERLNSHRLARQLLIDLAPFSTLELKKFLEILLELGSDFLDKLVVAVQKWAETANDDDMSLLANSLRRSTVSLKYSKVEQEHKIWNKVQKLEKILIPDSPYFKHLWLFGNSHIDRHLIMNKDDEDEYNFHVYDENLKKIRLNAIHEIQNTQGVNGFMDFLLKVERADYVADVLLPIQESPENRAIWIKRVLKSKNYTSLKRFLLRAMANTNKIGIGQTMKLLQEDKSINNKRFNLLAEVLPATPESWKLAKKYGADFEKSYWKNVRVWPDKEINHKDLKYAIQQLLNANRPDAAFFMAESVKENLPSHLWVKILEKFVEINTPKSELPERYYLEQIFEILDNDPTIDEEKIADLEYPYLTTLLSYGHFEDERETAWQKMMTQSPNKFLQILNWYYKCEDEVENKNQDRIGIVDTETRTRIAFNLLEAWKIVPGTNEKGKINNVKFNSWIQKAYELARDENLVPALEHHLATIFAKSALQNSHRNWLPKVILDLLEKSECNTLREEFFQAVDSVRGGTGRPVYEGGAQELKLAEKYEKLELKFQKNYPNISKIMKKLVELYKADAQIEDNKAESRKRWGML